MTATTAAQHTGHTIAGTSFRRGACRAPGQRRTE